MSEVKYATTALCDSKRCWKELGFEEIWIGEVSVDVDVTLVWPFVDEGVGLLVEASGGRIAGPGTGPGDGLRYMLSIVDRMEAPNGVDRKSLGRSGR